MRKALAVAFACAFMSASPALAGKYHHPYIPKPPVYKPPIVKPKPPVVKPKQPQHASKSNTGAGDYLAGLGLCFLVGQFVNTIYVGEVEKRQRTQEDEWAVFANCLLPILGGYLVKEHWKGKQPVVLAHFREVNWFPKWQK